MRAYCLAVVLILAMISALYCIPIEVVYTGDSCACPKSLNYLVNVPPPPQPKESKRYEHGYKLEVPPPAKTKMTYTFDFTVQEPKTPIPMEDEKLNLYAKVDRITAHKKDCVPTKGVKSPLCKCVGKCQCSHCRYVSSAMPLETVIRQSSQSYDHPNSLYKTSKRTPYPVLAWAAIVTPVKKEPTFHENQLVAPFRSRSRRDLSSIFGLNRKTNNEKRSERMIKQYTKRLPPKEEVTTMPSIIPSLGENFKPFAVFPKLNDVKRPFEKLHEMMFSPPGGQQRKKRDIKGEYDMLEKEREQMDLTLPEIIQYMPETLDPNFKRGRCQFGNCQLHGQHLHKSHKKEFGDDKAGQSLANDEPINYEASDDHKNVSGKGDQDQDNEGTHNSSNASSENDINRSSSLSPKKRNVNHYSCSHLKHFISPPPPSEGYYIESYDDARPFPPTGPFYEPPYDMRSSQYDAANPAYLYPLQPVYPTSHTPQQFYAPEPEYQVGPKESYDLPTTYPSHLRQSLNDDVHITREPINSPLPPGFNVNPYLDQVIADIVSQHVAFIESHSPKDDELVEHPLAWQDKETKSFLKLLAEGRFQRLFGEEDERPDAYAPAGFFRLQFPPARPSYH
ncbi:uncharacterized protein LOC106087807 [Stomoxys calcitrans]|uniref:Uncharacterized protein n=1 Tax=Stomoxys calcitrans TaxID=35570 RepID=A0A1I8P417_STOCA|nr:uncharacterized protein LOC106087807 [Stomoxys calcitrans]